MTFNQLVWRMAKKNKQKYLFYYLCNSFAVLFFFMFATIYYNEEIVEVKQIDSIDTVLIVPGVALVVFAIFFINYAHGIFIKRRRKEFGLFMTLGMSSKDFCKLLLLESGVIAVLSIISGIITGAVFSRLFFLVLMNSTGFDEVPFQLNVEMFKASIGAFLLVYLVSVGKTLILTVTQSLTHSLKSDRVTDSLKFKSPLFGGVGIVIVIGSAFMLYYTYLNPSYGGSDGSILLLFTILLLLGLYVALSQCMSFFIEMAKKYKPFYFRRLLFLSNLEYKFKQQTGILMLVTVMSMVTIFYSSVILFIYLSTEDQVTKRNPYTLTFVESETKNRISEEELYSILDKKEHPLTDHLVLPVFEHTVKHAENWFYDYAFVRLSDFNSLTGSQKVLSEGEFIYFLNNYPEYTYMDEPLDRLTIKVQGENVTLPQQEAFVDRKVNIGYEYFILNDGELDALKQNVVGVEYNIHLINTDNWKNTSFAVTELEKSLTEWNEANLDEEMEETYPDVRSRVKEYDSEKNAGAILFFVSTFLSVMFFFGTFILLYLSLFSDVEQERKQYRKLFKIGITSKEMKANISKELAVLFFFAPLLGSCLAFVYVLTLAKDVGGILQNPNLFKNFLVISLIYLAIQTIYYVYARRKMWKQLL
ncbi:MULTISPECIES: FtsX-like permease family protein [Bacillus]|uniref:FtsX-like permease family protein n=1 Tax=Bacillus TaxID=1386 RepID=UPI000BB97151|nr:MULTISPECIES: ABC transporter permease [Bacillus]